MKSRANTEQSFFDKVPTEEQKALIQTALWLKSVISYPPEEQSKGKSPKFRGSDAMDILIAQNFVASEDAASKTLLLMERVGLLACSKGTGKSPKKEAAPRMRRYRFSADSRLSAAAENLNDDATAVATLIDAPPVHALVQFKVLRIVAFLVAIACLLGPVSICDTLPVNVEPESLKLYGSFILGLCVCLLFVDEPENVQEVAQLTRDADAKRASRTSSAGVKQIPASEENNIPTVDIKKVLISLAEVTRMTGEYEWITAGRLLTACQRAVDGADPESVVGKHAKVLLESEAMEDCRERYMVAVEGLGLLAKEDGWVLFSENAAGTKVYSKYEDGGFWIKVDGKLHIGGNACAAVWKEGDLYHKWFPQVGWSKIFYQVRPTLNLYGRSEPSSAPASTSSPVVPYSSPVLHRRAAKRAIRDQNTLPLVPHVYGTHVYGTSPFACVAHTVSVAGVGRRNRVQLRRHHAHRQDRVHLEGLGLQQPQGREFPHPGRQRVRMAGQEVPQARTAHNEKRGPRPVPARRARERDRVPQRARVLPGAPTAARVAP